MPFQRPLVTPIANLPLEQALQQRLQRRSDATGSMGELEPLAVQLGLIQNTLKPVFDAPQLVLFAGDHGLAVDGVGSDLGRSTGELVRTLLNLQMPLAAFAKLQGLQLCVVDSGVADPLPPHACLLARKIAHGTRNAKSGPAMSQDQVSAAVRAGMEIARSLPGNVVACAGIGVGSFESAALVLARLSGVDLRKFIAVDRQPAESDAASFVGVLEAAQNRNRDAVEPLAVLAAFGGFETAMMVGMMLVAASERHLILADGMTAFAALLVASRLSPAVPDYCLYCRSQGRKGIDEALSLFNAAALLEVGVESTDGTGITLAWPLVRIAGALLTDVGDVAAQTRTVPGTLV
jgi:nicotinate-nucleotide--dimethylbenzimidazole phosphoribosyltransferase